jgi:iron complex outermembrane receptor protein
VDDYIYLQGETEEDHEEHDEHDHGGLPLVNYMQKDAQFQGYEIEVGRSMEFGAGDLALTFIRDSVNAEFNGGEDVPRINPARNIYAATYTENDLEVSLKLKDVESQYDFGMTETSTDGFKMLDFNAVKTYEIDGDKTAKFTLFARNLLDEKARNHSSFVKNEVPLPGRNIGVRVQLEL